MFRKRFAITMAATAAASLVSVAMASAADEPTLAQLQEKLAEHTMLLNTVWTLVAAFLVFWMQAGFAYVEAGLTRAKNTSNILMKNLMDFCLGTVGYWAIGFGLMFGAGNLFFGTQGFFLVEKTTETFASLAWTDIPLYAKFMFQLVFAGTAATIVSGAMAERTKFSSYLVYSFVISAVVYPVVGHWIWGGGWLAAKGMWDFAGSTVVHSVGGWMALAGAIVLGPRLGKFNKDGSVNSIPGHSMPMAALGVFILWLGWFGFNPGSTMAATANIGHIAMTTNVAAAVGGIVAMFITWLRFGKPDVSMTLNGVLAGLVAVTAGCAFISPASAAAIGAIGGVAVVFSVLFLDRIRVDDPVGAVSVHGVCGALGTLLLGLFAQDQFSPGTTGNGLLFGGGAKLLAAQAMGVGSVLVWSLLLGFALFSLLKVTVGLRVTAEEELEGLDIGEHGGSAYPDFAVIEPPAGKGVPAAPGLPAPAPAPLLKPKTVAEG